MDDRQPQGMEGEGSGEGPVAGAEPPGGRELPVPPARPARESRVEMTELVLPNDANPLGNILGGKVMHLMDIAGALAAARHSRRVCVTASVDRIDFLHPIRVGEAILVEAQVTDAGRTSMEVRVNVYSENLRTGQRRHTATAFFTFVALDEHGRPTPVPAVIAETPDEQRLQIEARRRRQARLARAGRVGTAEPEAGPPAGGDPSDPAASVGAPDPPSGGGTFDPPAGGDTPGPQA
ncbi:acyl-CoA thioesterase [Thermaerobacter marianensis]|nr:acyl-CoA thioesterase [Thermaerobacter marianensis]